MGIDQLTASTVFPRSYVTPREIFDKHVDQVQAGIAELAERLGLDAERTEILASGIGELGLTNQSFPIEYRQACAIEDAVMHDRPNPLRFSAYAISVGDRAMSTVVDRFRVEPDATIVQFPSQIDLEQPA